MEMQFRVGNDVKCRLKLAPGGSPEPPGPTIDWDETKIAIVLLDENDRMISVHYEETIHDARAYLNSNLDKRYYVRLGDRCGIFYLPCKVDSEGEQNTEAFYNCTNMVFLHLGKCVEGFGSSSETGPGYYFGALHYCTALKKVTYAASSFNFMRDGTFAHCSSLESVTIPNGITEIPSGSFYENSALRRIVLPDGITTIRNGAAQFLNNCEIVIPSSISTIEPAAFWGSDSMTIRIDKPQDSIPNSPWSATNSTVIWEG